MGCLTLIFSNLLLKIETEAKGLLAIPAPRIALGTGMGPLP